MRGTTSLRLVRTPPAALLVTALLALLASGCDRARKSDAPSAAADATAAATAAANGAVAALCFDCHGDPANGNSAPPRSVGGATTTADVGVGAHQAHVRGGTARAGLACTECHVLPERGDPFRHIDGRSATLTWGLLSRSRGATASSSRATAADGAPSLTCTNYCHAPSAKSGGSQHLPSWTVVDGTQASCGSCHGVPPPAPHPVVAAGVAGCAACHPSTVRADGTIDVAAGKHVNGLVEVSAQACTSCHGDATRAAVAGADPNVAAAPPLGTQGETVATARAVGAHEAHVNKTGAISAPIACRECHLVPASLDGHPSGRVDVTFGPLASTGGAVPLWSGASCASTYCHGSFHGGAGSAAAPAWTTPGALGCTSCHGSPPPPETGHPQSASCGSCHTGYTATSVDVATHVNGRVDVVAVTCTTCHGTPGRTGADPNIAAAPPAGTKGETATTARAVGAHQIHLQGGAIRAALACTECHLVPTNALHADGAATVTFGALARSGGANPTWSGGSCSATYCHGGTLAAGGTNRAPVWTTVDGTQAACGTCHAIPPAPATGHPAVAGGSVTLCAACHGATVKADGTIDLAGGKHVNGTVEVSGQGCTSCHGDASRAAVAGADANVGAAPPLGTHAETLASTRAVGAHQAHVNKGAGALARPLACAECHVVPASASAHPDGRVDVAFGTVATTGGTIPVWTGTTCASTYCHGSFRGGAGSGAAPAWTTAGALGCTNCHGSPPAASTGHPQNANCGACHVGYTSLTVNVATHVNGLVEYVPMTCTSCHGTAGRTGLDPDIAAAPPLGASGQLATTARAVGAHLQHLQAGNVRSAMLCSECHVVPAQPLHADGTAAVTFGPLASAGGASPTWTGTTCATYCHGATLQGGTATQPVWTTVDGTQRQCTSCHGAPPAGTSGHPAVTGGLGACAWCHPQTVKADGTIDLAGGKHVNGTVESVSQTCTSCHGDPARTLVAGADANAKAAPPVGSHGETLATTRAVGAHEAHLNRSAGALARPTACTECHTVPSNTSGHPNGTVEIAFGALARTGGVTPVWNGGTCASTYCHGQFAGGASGAPAWAVPGALGCTSCHGNPPAASTGHPQNTSCGSCHTGYTSSTVNLATHVNGQVDLAAVTTCTTCHGTAGRSGTDPNLAAAPPLGTRGETLTSARAVGAHLEHLRDGALRAAVACTECHAIPTQNIHASGTVKMTWGALATSAGAVPQWSGTTCSSTYCHGSTLGAGGSNRTPTWTTVDGTQVTCGSCHDTPPSVASGHPSVVGGVTACVSCHPATVKADGTIDVAAGKHINGVVDVSGVGCTSCHGTAGRTGTDPNIAAAPPVGTHGESATTQRAVGAHQRHLVDGPIRSAIACNECHVVPASLTGHPSGTVNVTFGTLATTGPTAPLWNGTSCSATYCHGSTLGAGGTANAPLWTTVDGTQRACTSCHDQPPSAASGHPAVGSALTGCAACHPATMKADGTIDVAGGKHVNGTIEASTTCTSCHGDANRSPAAIAAAPPRDTAGNAVSDAVGAHLAHLTGGTLRSALACNDCHAVPSDAAHATQALDLTWGALARTDAVSPSWSATTLTCTNYCHGITLFGGSNTSPVWNGGAAQADCGTCHGLPPTRAVGASRHPLVPAGRADCYRCHPSTMSGTGTSIDTVGGKHVDGSVEIDYTNMTCTTCHGDAARVAVAGADTSVRSAPPVGTHGETLTSTKAVGAHQAHLNRGTFATPVACSECHVVPASTSHSDGTVLVTFGTVAKTGNRAPTWSGTTCSNTHCHAVNTVSGATAGGSNRTPTWTTGTMTCTSCHLTTTLTTGKHQLHIVSEAMACSGCHGAGFTSTTVSAALHVNGVRNIAPGAWPTGPGWNATTRSCTNGSGCHGGTKGPW